MKKAFFPIALATIILASGAQAQDERGGPIEIDKCQTISQPGSYKLVNNLTFPGSTGTCLPITADFVTIDLAGFSITGTSSGVGSDMAIMAGDATKGIAVRNGSISGFGTGVDLGGDGSIVEGLRVFGRPGQSLLGIGAKGIVKGNIVEGIAFLDPHLGVGIAATGIVTGNYIIAGVDGMAIGQGSTVIGNTVMAGTFPALEVSCPSNVTDNTVVRVSNAVGPANIFFLNGEGCTDTNNVVAP